MACRVLASSAVNVKVVSAAYILGLKTIDMIELGAFGDGGRVSLNLRGFRRRIECGELYSKSGKMYGSRPGTRRYRHLSSPKER